MHNHLIVCGRAYTDFLSTIARFHGWIAPGVKTLEGFRVWLDIEKSKRFPDVYNWYMRLAPKEALPLDVLLKSIEEAGRHVLSFVPVRVV